MEVWAFCANAHGPFPPEPMPTLPTLPKLGDWECEFEEPKCTQGLYRFHIHYPGHKGKCYTREQVEQKLGEAKILCKHLLHPKFRCDDGSRKDAREVRDVLEEALAKWPKEGGEG